MFQKYFFAGMLAITGCVVQAQYLDDASGKRLKKDLQYLASDELAGRQPGTGGELEAAEYIAAAFKKAGLNRLRPKVTCSRLHLLPEPIIPQRTT